MIKFSSDIDAKMFYKEVESLSGIEHINKDYKPSEEILERFLRKRKGLIGKIRNFRKSQNQKKSWRSNRKSFMKGIKKFHKSTQGKRFHRALGRYNATRENLQLKSENNDLNLVEVLDILKGLSSLKTHILIEGSYFRTVEEESEFLDFFEEVIPFIDRLSKNIIEGDLNITKEDQETLLTLIEDKEILNSLSENNDISLEEVTKIFEENKDLVDKEDVFYFSKLYELINESLEK